jgi:hypothetical protein
MVKCGVLFEVWAEFLNIIYKSFGFNGLMVKIFNSRLAGRELSCIFYYNFAYSVTSMAYSYCVGRSHNFALVPVCIHHLTPFLKPLTGGAIAV